MNKNKSNGASMNIVELKEKTIDELTKTAKELKKRLDILRQTFVQSYPPQRH